MRKRLSTWQVFKEMVDTLKTKSSRREQILQIAKQLFSQKTYHGTSLEDIAEAVGMPKGSIYYWFDSKEDLLASILIDAQAVIDKWLEEIASADLSPMERLREIIKAHVKFNVEYQEATTLFLIERNVVSSVWKTELVKSRRQRDKLLLRTLTEAIEAGVYSPQDLKLAVRAIVGMCNALVFWYRASGARSPDEIADYFFQLLQDGLAVRP